MENNKIVVFDTTLRDGEQTPGVNLNLSEKLEIARQLEKLGVDVIEAGFPAASPGDFESVRAVSQTVNCSVAALCRCTPGDIQKAWEAVKYSKKPRIHMFIATSPIHMTYKLKLEAAEVLARAVDCVKLGKSLCEDIEISCEDASRSDVDFLYQVVEAVIDAGATTVNLPDTVGYSMPSEFGEFINGFGKNVPNIDKAVISVHCHNDLGLATANTLAAIQNGARQVETTINGLGERAGNCSMEEVVMSLSTRENFFHCTHGIDTKRIFRTSQRVAKITSIPVPVCKAIVGGNAFAHESGIHQHGMLANPMTYEIMTPESVGQKQTTLVLGKLSGRHAFDDRLKEMGFSLSKEEIDSAFIRFKELADRKKEITDSDLEALVSHKVAEVPCFYELLDFQFQSGKEVKAMASITLRHNNVTKSEAATGDGPVDAAYNAISRIVGGDWQLASYDIKAVTEGKDALGEVTVRLKHDGASYTGKGLSTDVIESSIRAFINAANRAYAEASKNA